MSITRHTILLFSAALLLALPACNPKPKEDPGPAGGAAVNVKDRPVKGQPAKVKPPESPSKTGIPLARAHRPYQDVHEDVKKAWFMVEAAYLVVGDKYQAAYESQPEKDPEAAKQRSVQQKAVTLEIEKNLFGVKKPIQDLFESALKAEPENPLNLVAYAVYLKPRRDYSKPHYEEQETRALELMDQAIKLWPDEACFYVTKTVMMVSPQRVHEYYRTTPMEEEILAQRHSEVRDLLSKAEALDKENFYINYYRAQLIARFATEQAGGEKAVAEARAEMLREIKAGNKKQVGDFCFPPPLDPYYGGARELKLMPAAQSAIYYDNWSQFGWYDISGLQALMMTVVDKAEWPKNKEDIGALMWMFYQMGRTRPFERTYFSWQQRVLTAMRDKDSTPQPEKVKLSAVLFKLNDLYVQACQNASGIGIYIDPKQFDAIGLNDVELKNARNARLKEIIQPLHASFLSSAGEELGLKFPLDPDPKKWGE